MKIRFAVYAFLLGVFIAAPAFALELHQARSAGLIGEKVDGYIAAIASSAEVKNFVAELNTKRRQQYEKIAKEQGQSVDVVAKLAAQEVISKLPPGSAYQAADGSWKKR